MGARESHGSVERHGREISCSCDANLLIGFRHAPLRPRNIRATLQKIRRKPNRNARRLIFERHCRDTEFRGRLANQDGDGVLKLRSLHSDIGVLNARGVQLCFRLGNIRPRGNSSFEPIRGELQIVRVSFHGIVEELFLRIRAAQLEIIHGQLRLQAKLRGCVISTAGLGLFARGSHRAPHTTPKVQLIRKIKGQHEIAHARLLDFRRKARRIVGRFHLRGTRRRGDGWKLLSPIAANRRASFAEARFEHFQVLVRSGDLFFQLVELRIAENFPPVPVAGLIRRVRRLPLLCSLIGGRHFLLGGRRYWGGGLGVLRANGAALKGDDQQHEQHGDDACKDIAHNGEEVAHLPNPPAGFPLTRTGMPSTSESGGSTMAASLGCRPEMISTVLPKSCPIFTGTSTALPSRTSPTCKPSLRKMSVFDETTRDRVWSGSLRCTKTYAPGKSRPVALSISTSTSSVREARSMEFVFRTMVPRKVSPGNSSSVSVAVPPERTLGESTSGTATYTPRVLIPPIWNNSPGWLLPPLL